MARVSESGTRAVSEALMSCIQTFDLLFYSSIAKMLAGPSGTMAQNTSTTRSISMSNRFPSGAPCAIPLYPRTRAVEASTHDAHDQSSTFLRWLDNYFRTTPEERMADEYNAYWN
jgi:hypothetical protein